MTGPLSTDMYLASFTDIADELNSPAYLIQLTLTTFLLGLGVGQLFLGPLSDSVGRKPVLIASLSIFALSGVLLIFSPSIWFFIILRAIQGVSGAASVVLSRAIAADLTRGPDTVRALSLIAMLVGLGPVVAPPIGAAVGLFFGWRGVLATIALLALLMLLAAIFVVKESLPPEKRHRGGIRTTLKNFGLLLGDRAFFLLLVGFGMTFGSMMAYISASPFVGQVFLGMNQIQYAFAFAAGASALIIANFINAKLARTIQPASMLLFGTTLSFVCAILILSIVLLGALTWWIFILGAFLLIAGVAFTMSNSSALALFIAKNARGSGSALLGASQFLIGAAVSPIVGAWGESTALPMSIIIAAGTFLAFLAAVLFNTKYRKATRS